MSWEREPGGSTAACACAGLICVCERGVWLSAYNFSNKKTFLPPSFLFHHFLLLFVFFYHIYSEL